MVFMFFLSSCEDDNVKRDFYEFKAKGYGIENVFLKIPGKFVSYELQVDGYLEKAMISFKSTAINDYKQAEKFKVKVFLAEENSAKNDLGRYYLDHVFSKERDLYEKVDYDHVKGKVYPDNPLWRYEVETYQMKKVNEIISYLLVLPDKNYVVYYCPYHNICEFKTTLNGRWSAFYQIYFPETKADPVLSFFYAKQFLENFLNIN